MANSPSEQEFDSLHSTAPIHPKVNNGIIYGSKKSRFKYQATASKKTVFLCLLLAVGGITCCIVGVVFFERAKRLKLDSGSTNGSTDPISSGKKVSDDPCKLSKEVQESGLLKFFKKVDDTFFRLNPHEIVYRYPATRSYVIENFQPYDPKPSTLKILADTSSNLLKELRAMKYKRELLKPREAKTLSKTIHFLEHNFGNPYDNGYYTGEWMLGPSRFCHMQKFFTLRYTFNAYLGRASPRTVKDFERVMKILKSFKKTINQYRQNMQMGVKVGMVNSLEECKVGYDCIADSYPYISSTHMPESILREYYFKMLVKKERFSRLNKTSTLWLRKYGKTLRQSLRDALVNNLGQPLAELFNYLSNEHRRHCVPSNVSSGLATRPVSYVYRDGVPDLTRKTTKILPTGEKVSGKKAYERILKFFTTTESTPDDVHKLGWDILKSLYPQMIDIAKSTTNQANETKAVAAMRKYVNSSEMYFNTVPFPANESDERAHIICRKLKSAKVYCPVRYATLEKWFSYSQSALSMFRPKLIRMFHWMTGPKKTTPICPVSMATNFVPSAGSPSYESGYGPKCSRPAKYYLPFFLDRMGPKYSEWTVSAHEALPGHHLQSQGYIENFQEQCLPLLGALLRSKYSTNAFTEGWGVYAENPLIAQDTDTYKDFPMQKYGMLKWQIWRALRLIIDTGLHYKGMTRKEALQLLDKYAWDDSDVAQKEVTRYQSGPGQATAYMIGQRAIMDMRKKAILKLGNKFKIRDFHYFILSRGVGPLSFVADQIDRYIECEINPSGPGCDLVSTSKAFTASSNVAKNNLLYEQTMNPAEIHEF